MHKWKVYIINISACNCPDFTICNYPNESKVPLLERQLLQDQRGARKMITGGLDKEATSKMEKKFERASKSRQTWALDEFPCHSKAVERHIRIVSQAAASVCGDLRRDGYIRAKLLSRADIPHFG